MIDILSNSMYKVNKVAIAKEILWVISNILAGSPYEINMVMRHGIF